MVSLYVHFPSSLKCDKFFNKVFKKDEFDYIYIYVYIKKVTIEPLLLKRDPSLARELVLEQTSFGFQDIASNKNVPVILFLSRSFFFPLDAQIK